MKNKEWCKTISEIGKEETNKNKYYISWYSDQPFFGGYDSMYLDASTINDVLEQIDAILTHRFGEENYEILEIVKLKEEEWKESKIKPCKK